MADDRLRVSRRDLLRGAGVAAIAGAVSGHVRAEEPGAGKTDDGIRRIAGATPVELHVNGRARTVTVEPRTTLLDALRDRAGLTGAKRICDRGACGGCTVFVDEQPVNACMMLALDAEGARIRTIEGLAADGALTPLQEAFVTCDAAMCGFCTPGMVMACTALLAANPKPSDAEIRAGVSGNLCRCGTYTHVFDAVREVSR